MNAYSKIKRPSTVAAPIEVPASPASRLRLTRERLIEAFRECPRFKYRIYPSGAFEVSAGVADSNVHKQRHRREFRPERDLSGERFGPDYPSPDREGFTSSCAIAYRKDIDLEVTYYPTNEATHDLMIRAQEDYRRWDRFKIDGGEFIGGTSECARGWRDVFEDGSRPGFDPVTFSFSPPDFHKHWDIPAVPMLRDDVAGQAPEDRVSDWYFACGNPDRKWRVVSARIGDLPHTHSISHAKGKFVRLTRIAVAIWFPREGLDAIWHFQTVIFSVAPDRVPALNAASDAELDAIFETAKRDGAPVAIKVAGPFR